MATVVKLERQPRGATALARTREELAALPRAKVLQVNLEVHGAVSTVTAALPALRALRAQIIRELPAFDLANIDKLPELADGMVEADLRLKAAVPDADQRRALLPEAKRLRTLLCAVATALMCRRLLRPAALKRLRGASGYANLAYDLQLLASTLRAAWPRVEKSCPLPLAELDRATHLADGLCGSSLSDAAASSLAEAKDLRCRAFTLFIVAYTEVRRAVGYLRARKGDADSIAPPLYKGRPRRRAPRGKRTP